MSVPSKIEIQTSKSGVPCLTWEGKYLHSRYDPWKEAEQQVKGLVKNLKNENQLVIFIGAGLGYNLELFCETYANPVIWFEVYPEIFDYALDRKDSKLKTLCAQSRIETLSGDPTTASFFEGLKKKHLQYFNPNEILIYSHRALYTIEIKYFQFHESLQKHLNHLSVNQATLTRFERIWMRNLLCNFKILHKAQPIQNLWNTYHKLQNQKKINTALVCGAGPSLEFDFPLIREIVSRGEAILICVDTALSPLLDSGIQPDIVFTVDPQAISRHYLEPNILKKLNSNCAFVVDPACSYFSLRTIEDKFPIFYFWSPFKLAHVFFDFIGGLEVKKIQFGGSVLTNAYDFAVQMDCKNIVLAGADFAFTDGLAHLRGSILEKNLLYKTHRTYTNESHNYMQLHAIPSRKILADENENHEYLATNDKLIIFQNWIEKRIFLDKGKGVGVFKLSARGAKLQGVKKWALSWNDINNNSSVNRNERNTENFFFYDDKKKKKNENETKNYTEFKLELRKLKDDFELLQKELLRAIELTQKNPKPSLKNKNNNPTDFQNWLKKIEGIDKEIQRLGPACELAGNIVQKNIFEIMKSKTPKGDQEEWIRISLNFYEAMNNACLYYKKWIERSLRR